MPHRYHRLVNVLSEIDGLVVLDEMTIFAAKLARNCLTVDRCRHGCEAYHAIGHSRMLMYSGNYSSAGYHPILLASAGFIVVQTWIHLVTSYGCACTEGPDSILHVQ